jgi:hypothetical protein
MATIIEQKPLYDTLPIGQQVMFSVSNGTIVANQLEVKFVAEVHISNTPINLAVSTNLIATLKTTPNNKGIGIFDLRPILESYASPDYLGWTDGTNGSEYKGTQFSGNNPNAIHLIDKYARSENGFKYFAIQFSVDYVDATSLQPVSNADAENSDEYKFFNGVIQFDDNLKVSNNDYGYDLTQFYLTGQTSTEGKFISNAPLTQDAQLIDYGVLSFFNLTNLDIANIKFTFKDSSGSTLGTETVIQNTANGGALPITSDLSNQLLYVGAFPGNLDNWSTVFDTHKANISSYTVVAFKSTGDRASQEYTINIMCPANSSNQKGFEGIRLTWLNQWGAWDYYTFNMKSIKSITTNRTTYTQQSGTWNGDTFRINGYKGGQKNFRVNSTEKITMNTDFVDEATGVWFEELINSPEVYVLEGFQTDPTNSALNTYVQPVRLMTSSYTRKTIANDKLMQYTFEVEKSKMKRTQSI